MTKASDIANLFARFGGKPERYQEITKTNALEEARQRWPLLRAIDDEAYTPTPIAHRGPDRMPEPVRKPAPRSADVRDARAESIARPEPPAVVGSVGIERHVPPERVGAARVAAPTPARAAPEPRPAPARRSARVTVALTQPVHEPVQEEDVPLAPPVVAPAKAAKTSTRASKAKASPLSKLVQSDEPPLPKTRGTPKPQPEDRIDAVFSRLSGHAPEPEVKPANPLSGLKRTGRK